MRRVAAVIAAAVLTATVAACSGSSASASRTYKFNGATKIGTVIPQAKREPIGSYSGTLLGHGHSTLAAQTGTVTVVNFWASWCPPCQIETPQFDTLYRQLKARGVKFVGIDFKDSTDGARAFIRKYDISFPNFFDEEGEAQLRLGNILAQGPPFSLVLDRHRDVAAVYVGRQSDDDMRRGIDTLLAEK
jgi:thiol-disulfide isomerase/thioredoxin